jgi:hypothetical protein
MQEGTAEEQVAVALLGHWLSQPDEKDEDGAGASGALGKMRAPPLEARAQDDGSEGTIDVDDDDDEDEDEDDSEEDESWDDRVVRVRRASAVCVRDGWNGVAEVDSHPKRTTNHHLCCSGSRPRRSGNAACRAVGSVPPPPPSPAASPPAG